jgi:hypothetical protein
LTSVRSAAVSYDIQHGNQLTLARGLHVALVVLAPLPQLRHGDTLERAELGAKLDEAEVALVISTAQVKQLTFFTAVFFFGGGS